MTIDPNAGYEAPVLISRGWRVGPNEFQMNLAAGADDYQANVLYDPSYATDLSHWPQQASGVHDPDEGFSDLGSIRFDSATLMAGFGYGYAIGDISATSALVYYPVVAGQKVSASAWVKYTGFTGQVDILIQRVTSVGVFIANDTVDGASEVVAADSDWKWLHNLTDYIIPDDGTAFIAFLVFVLPTTSTGSAWFDDASMRVSYGPTSGVGQGLPAVFTPQLNFDMLPATGSGDGLAGDILFTPVANFDMLPADGSGGDGLAAAAVFTVPVDMNLADGSGGNALVPTLSVVTPIAFGTKGGGVNSSDSGSGVSASWSHTRGASDNFVVLQVNGSSLDPYSDHTRTATYGGASMTSLGVADYGYDSPTGTYVWTQWWYKASPASGAQTVAITISGTGVYTGYAANSFSYSNVGSIGGSIVTSSGTTSPFNQTVSSATGRVILRTGASAGGNLTATNQTVRHGQGTPAPVQEAPGAASVLFTASGFSGGWKSSAIELLP